MHGVKVDRYLKQIKKVSKDMPEDTRITFKEYVAFQYFLQNVDLLKSKVSQYRYMDYDMFCEVIQAFCKENDYCKQNKVTISEAQAKACFLLLDLDESGELE